ncbi:MAG: hypothetical protein ABW124_04905 [Candidatus Thiodiazotropha sp. 6PLUC9]
MCDGENQTGEFNLKQGVRLTLEAIAFISFSRDSQKIERPGAPGAAPYVGLDGCYWCARGGTLRWFGWLLLVREGRHPTIILRRVRPCRTNLWG